MPQDVEWAIARGPARSRTAFLPAAPAGDDLDRRAVPTRAPPNAAAGLRSRAVRAAQRLQGARHVSPRDNEAPPAHGLPATPAADVAAAAARAGGAVLLARWHAGDLQIDYKDARANLVTVADRRSQQAVTDIDPRRLPRARHRRRGGHGGKPRPPAASGTSTRSTAPPTTRTGCRSSASSVAQRFAAAGDGGRRGLRPGPRRDVRGGPWRRRDAERPAAARLGRRPGSTGRWSSRRPSRSTRTRSARTRPWRSG